VFLHGCTGVLISSTARIHSCIRVYEMSRIATITWCWKPISECPFCGSYELELDQELEFYRCRCCGSSGGGALFWELDE
jgi:hypothetical protein